MVVLRLHEVKLFLLRWSIIVLCTGIVGIGTFVVWKGITEEKIPFETVSSKYPINVELQNSSRRIQYNYNISQSGYSHNIVITEQREWKVFWMELFINSLSEFSEKVIPPTIDFSKEMVIAVVADARPSTGFEIEISKVIKSGSELIVHVKERKPLPLELVGTSITRPYHIIKLQRMDLPTTFIIHK